MGSDIWACDFERDTSAQLLLQLCNGRDVFLIKIQRERAREWDPLLSGATLATWGNEDEKVVAEYGWKLRLVDLGLIYSKSLPGGKLRGLVESAQDPFDDYKDRRHREGYNGWSCSTRGFWVAYASIDAINTYHMLASLGSKALMMMNPELQRAATWQEQLLRDFKAEGAAAEVVDMAVRALGKCQLNLEAHRRVIAALEKGCDDHCGYCGSPKTQGVCRGPEHGRLGPYSILISGKLLCNLCNGTMVGCAEAAEHCCSAEEALKRRNCH